MQKVKALFVSHEHTDHIKGIHALVKKYKVPVYITAATLFNSTLTLDKQLVVSFDANKPIIIGNLAIVAFPKLHDASDPYSFVVTCNKIRVGVFTDIGEPCTHVINNFKKCHAAFLEANYDNEMLDNGTYPYYLKKRIAGNKGHLSNKQALTLFKTHKPPFMSHLVLSHLSKNNNCPHLVQNLFDENCNGVKIIVASRYEQTAVYHIKGGGSYKVRINRTMSAPQLSFSFA